ALLLEAGGRIVGDRLVGMERAGAHEQRRLALRPLGVGHAAVDRANLGARLLVVEADALSALLGDDVEDVVGDPRMHRPVGRLPLDPALVDGGVRALRLAGAAVDAFAGDHRRHRVVLFRPAGERPMAGAAGTETAATGLPSLQSLTFFAEWVKPCCGSPT